MKKISAVLLSILCATLTVSCSVKTHRSIADSARSANAILVPLENPVLIQRGEEWYMQAYKAPIERYGMPVIQTVKHTEPNYHPERYSLIDDLEDADTLYASVAPETAQEILKGKYSHQTAISFINSKWTETLEGDTLKHNTTARTPDYFRNLSSHRLIQDGNKSYLIARMGELSADFNSIIMYPLAGLSFLLIDTPGSLLLGPPASNASATPGPEEL